MLWVLIRSASNEYPQHMFLWRNKKNINLIWSRFLIQIQILNGKQCRSRTVGFFRSQLIWIYTVCKGRIYPGSAGQGLTTALNILNCKYCLPFKMSLIFWLATSPELSFYNKNCMLVTEETVKYMLGTRILSFNINGTDQRSSHCGPTY